MKYIVMLLLFSAYMLPGTALADTVTCESRNNQRQECDMDTRGEVRLVSNLSKTRCVEGQNWGLFKHSVWVDGGCRATFESDGGGYREDDHGSGGGYAQSDDYPSLPTRVTCESRNNQRQECDMDTRGEVRLTRNLSSTRCVEGDNWGLFKHSVWVDGGCRAEFESDGGPSSGGRASSEPPSESIAACNAVEDWYGKMVEYSALKPGAWEIILDYGREGTYVCNVEGTRVTYFEKLRN